MILEEFEQPIFNTQLNNQQNIENGYATFGTKSISQNRMNNISKNATIQSQDQTETLGFLSKSVHDHDQKIYTLNEKIDLQGYELHASIRAHYFYYVGILGILGVANIILGTAVVYLNNNVTD